MTRLLLAVAGIALLALVALGSIWLAGQLLLGVGVFAVGTAGVLLRLLWFLLVSGVLGGAVYFLSNAWRPAGKQAAARPVAPSRGDLTVVSAVPRLHVGGQLEDQLGGQLEGTSRESRRE